MSSLFSTDIYQISETINELQKQYLPDVNDKTRAVGILGYLNDIESTQIQNAVITSSEMANEMWPSRARFERNVIAHSIIYNIEQINARPARMEIHFGIEENKLLEIMNGDEVIIDKECPIHIGGLEYHLPYDILITKATVLNNEKVYTARYKIDRQNELYSDLINPYLQAPFIQIYQTQRYIMIRCMIMQVEHETIPKEILTDNAIENKTTEFEFENQLASFEVKITEKGDTKYLTPVFEGIGVDQNIVDYCYYTYENANSIRVRFDSISYMPSINATIEVELKTSHGAEGNFEYKENLFASITSKKYGYNNVALFIIPMSKSEGGRDRKSVEELQRLLPKEALSRGSITNMSDLLSYFKMLDTDYARMSFQKKVDNQFERTYYSFLLLKDEYNNVVPTNTLDLLISKTNGFDIVDNRKRSLKTGCAVWYDKDQDYGQIMSRELADKYIAQDPNNHFVYTVPFVTVVNDDPLYISYYLTIFNKSAILRFSYINEHCPIQFIATSIAWKREYSIDPDTYKLDIPIIQNISADCGMIKLDENGDVEENNIKVVVVFYNNGTYDDENKPYRYQYATLLEDEDHVSGFTDYSYIFHMECKTNDKINDDAKMMIQDLYVPGTTAISHGYLSDNVRVKIYVLARLADNVNYGRYDLDQIIPEGIDDYTVTNMYEIDGGLDMYINFSDIVRSTVISKNLQTRYDTENYFLIDSVPLIKRSYVNMESNIQAFANMLLDRKVYLDNGRYLLENNFNIDFKLYNTYGPSKIYSLDEAGEQLVDRINISLYFEVKLVKALDIYTKDYIIRDIKEMIEDLNDIRSLHIPNLITAITTKYRPYSIEYIEFLGFNDYGPGEQHLYRNESEDVTITPEFINCNTDDNMITDINVRIV